MNNMLIKKQYNNLEVVRIDDVDGFREWLVGQTVPLLVGDDDPFGWAYVWDYERYINGLPVVD